MPVVIAFDNGPPFSNRVKDGYVVTPGPGPSPSFQQYVTLARAGAFDLDALLLSHDYEDDEWVILAYKLLSVSVDFGHLDAHDVIVDLFNVDRLRYDDDRFEEGNAHFELGLAYLMGADGLPMDPDKGKAHLERAHECHWPFSVRRGEILLDEARAILTTPQLAVFDEVYRPQMNPVDCLESRLARDSDKPRSSTA